MRRLPLAAVVAAALTLVAGGAVAQNAPRMVRISYSNPDPRYHMGLTWHSDSSHQHVVQYGVASVGEFEEPATATSPMGGGLGVVHSVSVAGLSAGTTYMYRVGSDADGWTPASGSYSITTAPDDPCAPFSFAALGDTRGDAYLSFMDNSGSTWPDVFAQLAGEDPDFVLIAGDLVDDGGDLAQWNDFFNQDPTGLGPVNQYLPVMPAFGNHDDGGGVTNNYEHLYTLPQNSVGDERYYYFEYANTLLIAFNTEERAPAGTFGEQIAWMEQVLIDNDATWKILFFHHPIWTTTPGETALGCLLYCGHPPDENGQNDVLIDLIDRYDIDVVIQSHNHFYERSEPMRGGGSHDSKVEPVGSYRGATVGVRDGSGRVPTWGSLYLLTGGGGAPIIPISTLETLGQVWAPGQVSRNDRKHHMRFTVSDTTLTMTVVETGTGAQLDSVTITKLDQYRVGSCSTVPPTDADSDGFTSDVDCNDINDTIYPGATEVCGDGIDQDCNGADSSCPQQDGGFQDGGTGGDRGDGRVSGGDSGPAGNGGSPGGCNCSGTSAGLTWFLAVVALVRRRKRCRSTYSR
ncbi:MAG: metallophosphoesterase [Myxococcota bacterium]